MADDPLSSERALSYDLPRVGAAATAANQMGMATGGTAGLAAGGVTGWGVGMTGGILIGLITGMFLAVALMSARREG